MSKQPYNAVGAYIYAGGFTIGMKKHLNVLAHLEDGDFGVPTVRQNMAMEVYTDPKEWPIAALAHLGCRVCFSNPPCAPWSAAGRGGKVGLDDPRLSSHKNTLSLLDQLNPDIWMWESVTQAYLGNHTELSQHVTQYGMDRGYTVYHFLHDAKFMGLPQQRRRVMTVLSKVRIDFPPPNADRVNCGDVLSQIQDPGELPEIYDRYLPFVGLMEEGDGFRDVYLKAGNEPPGPKWMDYRAYWDRPIGTQIGSPHIFHPKEDRMLGHKEVAQLCGYPPDYEFHPDGGYFITQIARAVTPTVGDYMGRVVVNALDRNERIETPEEWEVDYMAISNRIIDFRMKQEVKRLR